MTDPVDLSIRIDASPATVFKYMIDPVRMSQWMGVAHDLDPRPGGVMRVDVNGRNVAVGEYVEVVPDERVVFTWGWEDLPAVPPGSSRVEVTLTPDGDATLLRLRHFDLPDDDAAKSHAEGWSHYLARLEIAGAGGDPGPDPMAAQRGQTGGPD